MRSNMLHVCQTVCCKQRRSVSLITQCVQVVVDAFQHVRGLHVCQTVCCKQRRSVSLITRCVQVVVDAFQHVTCVSNRMLWTAPKCKPHYTMCPSGRRCVPTCYMCDGENDCGDNSDENPHFCRESYSFIVRTGQSQSPPPTPHPRGRGWGGDVSSVALRFHITFGYDLSRANWTEQGLTSH